MRPEDDAGEAEALDELRGRLAVRSRADVVRTALAVVEWMEAETARGRRVVAVGDDTDTDEIVVLTDRGRQIAALNE